jgi:hypothetical protein
MENLNTEQDKLTFAEVMNLLTGESTAFPKVPPGEKRKPIGTRYDIDYLNDKLIARNDNGVIDVEKYVDNMMELRLEYEDKKLPYPELLETGQKIKKNELLPEEIYNNSTLMQVVDDHIEARFGPNMIQRLTKFETGTEIPMEVARKIGGFSNYKKFSPKKRWEKFQNYMRSWEIGNFYTTSMEISAGITATDAERERMGAGYKLFDLQPNAFKGSLSGTGNYKEMGDALMDYGRSLAFDPLNFAGFGISKLISLPLAKGGKKALTESMNRLSKASYKKYRESGLSVLQARKKVFAGIANKNLATSTLKYMLPDMAINVAIDLGQQMHLVRVGNQEEVDKYRLGLIALTGAALPLTVGTGTYAYKELKRSPLFEKYFLNFEDVMETVRRSGKPMSKIVKDKVLESYEPLVNSVDTNFGIIKSNIKDLKKWEEAKKEASLYLKDKSDPEYENSANFLQWFFNGVKTKDGEQITKGYLEALSDAGWLFPKDAVDENQKATAILANTITWLDDKVVERAMKSYEEMTGVGLGFKAYTAKELESRYITLASSGARTNQVTSVAVKGLKIATDMFDGDATKAFRAMVGERTDEKMTPERLKFALSTFKRMLTSHPGTTGTNLKGFVALNLADTAAEYYTSVANLTQTGFYKIINDQTRAAYYGRQGWANFMSATKRGAAILDPDLNIQTARMMLDANPKVREELMRDMSGDGGMMKGPEVFNMGESTTAKVIDKTTKVAQRFSLMKLQDEYTKLWAFTNNMNRYIMKEYGVTPSVFFKDKDSALKINTQSFVDDVLMKAANQTQRQTASVNWSRLNREKGKNFWLSIATEVEKWTNSTALGFLVPFGSFANTVVATFGDYSGINFLRSAWRDMSGDPNHMVTSEQMGKMASGWTYLVYRTLYDASGNGNSGIEKVMEGRSYKQNYNDQGELMNSEFDWPIQQPELIAQIIAHGLSGDGRDVVKDLHGLNPVETVDYVLKNFNRENIPVDLVTELGLSLGFSAVRDTDRVIKYFSQKWYDIITGDGDNNEFVGMFADGVARFTNGILRPLEPFNVVSNIFNNNGSIPDLRQGNKTYNTAFKYVNSLMDVAQEAITGDKVVRPNRYDIVRGFEARYARDYSDGKINFGARRMPTNTLGHMMLNSIGMQSYKFSRWDGDPIVKNEMDKLAAPIFETLAHQLWAKYPNFFMADLKFQKQLLLGKGGLQEKLRKQTTDLLENYSPEYLKDIKYLSTFDKGKLNNIKEKIGRIYGIPNLESMDFSEILEHKDGLELLSIMEDEAKNYDEINFGFDVMEQRMGVN